MKNRNFLLFIVIIFLVSIGSNAGAEFYKYKDENGTIIFTDDYSQVPVDQRANAEKYNYDDDKEAVQPAAESGAQEEGAALDEDQGDLDDEAVDEDTEGDTEDEEYAEDETAFPPNILRGGDRPRAAVTADAQCVFRKLHSRATGDRI